MVIISHDVETMHSLLDHVTRRFVITCTSATTTNLTPGLIYPRRIDVCAARRRILNWFEKWL